MAHVGGVVPIGPPAAHAVLRVRRVLEPGARQSRIVHAEQECSLASLRERGDERVVGVRDERRPSAEAGDGAPPALGDVLELAVAVELVAEQVAEAHDPWARPPHPRAARTRPLRAGPGRRRAQRGGVEATPDARFAPEWFQASRCVGRGWSSPSPSSSSSRSSPRRARRPGRDARRARRARPGRASRRASRAVSSRRHDRRRAEPPDEPGGRRLEGEPGTHGAEPRRSLSLYHTCKASKML